MISDTPNSAPGLGARRPCNAQSERPNRRRCETGRIPGATSPEPKNEKLAEHKRHFLYPEPTAPPKKKPPEIYI